MIPTPVFLEQLQKFTSDLHQLVSQPSHLLAGVLRTWPTEAQVSAVYLISTPDDSEIVYAGMTVSQIVADRFHDHRNLRGGSDLRGILPRHLTYPQSADDYRVRWVSINDSRERKFFESFVIGTLCPPFNR